MTKKHLSFSAVNGFLECEARQKAMDDNLWEFKTSQGMSEGKLLEAILCGDPFPEETVKKNGDLYAWAINISETAERMLKDNLITEFLEGDYQQKYEFEFEGVKYVNIPDIVNNKTNRIVDIKKTVALTPQYSQKYRTRVMFYTERNYFLQLALAWHARGRKDECFLLTATSESPGNFDIFKLEENDLLIALDDLSRVQEHIMDIRLGKITPKRCEECDYCRSTKVASIKQAGRFDVC